MKLSFEWDEEKAEANLKKHKAGFDEATTVFMDTYSLTIHDPRSGSFMKKPMTSRLRKNYVACEAREKPALTRIIRASAV